MSFKEYKEVFSAAEDVRARVLEMHDADAKVYSPEFTKFIESQKPEISGALNLINNEGTNHLHAFRTSFNWWTDFLGQYLPNLNSLHSELVQQQNLLQAKKDEARHAKEAVKKNNDNLERARNRNNPSDISKYECQVDILSKKEIESQKEAEEQQVLFDEYNAKYQNNFVDSFATNISQLITGRQTILAQLSNCADKISEAIQTLSEPEDSSVAHLKSRLEDLEAVVIE